MALVSYPFENANTTEDQYTLLFRNFADTGVVGDPGDNQFLVTTDGSGLDVQVAPGYAIIRGHAVQNDGPVSITLDAASTQPRYDFVVLRLDPDLDGIVLAVVKGTPSANPVAPALTQTNTDIYDMPIARVLVSANTLNITAPDIVRWAPYGSTNVGVWNNTSRPPVRKGKMGFNVDTGLFEGWNGSGWLPVGRQAARKLVIPHTFTLVGPVAAASGDGDYFIPGFFIPSAAGQTARLVGARTYLHHGGSDAAFNADVVRDGFVLDAVNVARSTIRNYTWDHSLSGGAELRVVVTGIAGAPKNGEITLFVEYTV